MTTVIEFLERMGSDARLRTADGEVVGHAMEMAGIDVAARDAILTDDQGSLEAMAGVPANIFCGLHAPEDAPEEETPSTPGEPQEAPKTIVRRKRSGKKKTVKKKKKPAGGKKAPARKKKVSRKKPVKKSVKKKSGKKKTSRKKK